MSHGEMNKEEIRSHFEEVSEKYDYWKKKNYYYHDCLKQFYSSHCTDDSRVIEFGCGTGDILAAVPGTHKVGLDIAEGMINHAKEKYPDLYFHVHDAEQAFSEDGTFDVAVMADIIDHITDILKLYGAANRALKVGGKLCITTINPLWDPIFTLAEKMGQKMPEGLHNFVPNRYLMNFLQLRGFKVIDRGAAFLVPRHIPGVSEPLNRLAPKLPLINRLCAVQTIVAEKIHDHREAPDTDMSCTVVIPCYNEEGNVEECIKRTPNMGTHTEIIVVDDGSKDKTVEIARKVAETDSRVKVISYTPNGGKGHAVKTGLDAASGDVIMILDADMTVMPEETPLFFQPLAEGLGEFANGTRMIYPMEDQAMRGLNLIGNFCFGMILSWLMGHRISDSLCGTKAVLKEKYKLIPMGADDWGDFDLLFGASENKLKIVEVPVHYKARIAGESKMKPFKHGLVLLGKCWQGFTRLKLGIKPRVKPHA